MALRFVTLAFVAVTTSSLKQPLCSYEINCDPITAPCAAGLLCTQFSAFTQCLEDPAYLQASNKGRCVATDSGYNCASAADCCNPTAECLDLFCVLPCAHIPTSVPTLEPSSVPSTSTPTITFKPSTVPSAIPSVIPSANPTTTPSSPPSTAPSLNPSFAPTTSQPVVSPKPTSIPSKVPTFVPITTPSLAPVSLGFNSADSSSSSAGVGVIAGVTVGCVVLVVLFAVGVYLHIKRRNAADNCNTKKVPTSIV